MTVMQITPKEINEKSSSFFYNNEFVNEDGPETRRIVAINEKWVWVAVKKWGVKRQERSSNMNEVFVVNLNLTELTTDELCKIQMELGASISSLVANELDPTSHQEVWKEIVEEIVSRNS